MPTAEVPGRFKDRPEGSESKLNSIRDGMRILRTITRLLKQERPLLVFSALAAVFAITALALAAPVFAEYFATGLVPRLPTAVLSASLMILAFLSGAVGLILDTVTRGRQEAKRMQYLSVPGVHGRAATLRWLPRPTPDDPHPMTCLANSFPRFLAVGSIGFVVDAGVLWVLVTLGGDAYLSRGLSFAMAMSVTGRSTAAGPFAAPAALRCTANTPHTPWSRIGTAINFAVYALMLALLGTGPTAAVVALACGSSVALAVNYIGLKHAVFRPAAPQDA